jgi:hypothetical protein
MDDPKQISTVKIVPSSSEGDATIPIKCVAPSSSTFISNEFNSYRTLSIHVDEKPSISAKKKALDPSDAIRQIDVHVIDSDQVYHRYSTHPTLGLEQAAVERKVKDGKNVISPPPTQYILIIDEIRPNSELLCVADIGRSC